MLSCNCWMQAQDPCFWFGRQADCSAWLCMSFCAGAFVVLDLASGLFLSMTGSGMGRENISPRKKRWAPASSDIE